MTKKLSVKEVASTPGLFVSRMSQEVVEIRGTTFTIETLPKSVKRFAMGKYKQLTKGANTLGFVTFIFRLGCISIEGLTNSDGEKVEIVWEHIKIEGKNHRILSESIAEGLTDELVSLLGARVLTIGGLSDEELRKLDFTKGLVDEESSV